MNFEVSIETATSKAIADLAWELHRMQTTLESLDSRLDAQNVVGLKVVKELQRIGDACVEFGVSLETRP